MVNNEECNYCASTGWISINQVDKCGPAASKPTDPIKTCPKCNGLTRAEMLKIHRLNRFHWADLHKVMVDD